jgi:hypothetical protein
VRNTNGARTTRLKEMHRREKAEQKRLKRQQRREEKRAETNGEKSHA